MGGSGLPDAELPVEDFHGVEALAGFLEEASTPLTIAAIGPLTNIALLISLRPDLVPAIGQLVVMGGARRGGNVTRNAEFNIFADPHAARIVLSGKVPATVVPLDVTRGILPPQDWFDAMEGYGEPGRAVAAMWRESPVALHDVTVTGLLAWPELYSLESCSVDVIWNDTGDFGRTVFSRDDGPLRVVKRVDRQLLSDRVTETMKSYAAPP